MDTVTHPSALFTVAAETAGPNLGFLSHGSVYRSLRCAFCIITSLPSLNFSFINFLFTLIASPYKNLTCFCKPLNPFSKSIKLTHKEQNQILYQLLINNGSSTM